VEVDHRWSTSTSIAVLEPVASASFVLETANVLQQRRIVGAQPGRLAARAAKLPGERWNHRAQIRPGEQIRRSGGHSR
jgi:hypothetical protein